MARVCITDLQGDLDQAARRLTDHLLGAGDSLARDELQRRHPGCLLEHAREMKRAEFHQLGQCFDGYLVGELLADVVGDFTKLANRQPTAIDEPTGSSAGIFLGEEGSDQPGEISKAVGRARRSFGEHLTTAKQRCASASSRPKKSITSTSFDLPGWTASREESQ